MSLIYRSKMLKVCFFCMNNDDTKGCVMKSVSRGAGTNCQYRGEDMLPFRVKNQIRISVRSDRSYTWFFLVPSLVEFQHSKKVGIQSHWSRFYFQSNVAHASQFAHRDLNCCL